MNDDDKDDLAAAIAGTLEDSAYGIGTESDRDRTARLVVERIEPALRQMGWTPPETLDRVHAWGRRLSELPDHHINRDVLNSHLAELWDIA
jgi:hypothetical protein